MDLFHTCIHNIGSEREKMLTSEPQVIDITPHDLNMANMLRTIIKNQEQQQIQINQILLMQTSVLHNLKISISSHQKKPTEQNQNISSVTPQNSQSITKKTSLPPKSGHPGVPAFSFNQTPPTMAQVNSCSEACQPRPNQTGNGSHSYDPIVLYFADSIQSNIKKAQVEEALGYKVAFKRAYGSARSSNPKTLYPDQNFTDLLPEEFKSGN